MYRKHNKKFDKWVMEKDKVVASNLIWRLAERFGAQFVSFAVSIILARLLLPEAYGTITMITVFIAIMQVFTDSGLGNALIQKKDADDLDFSTVFYCNISFCVVLYAVLFAVAPGIASFYNKPELVSLTRVLGISLIVSGVKNIQQAYVSRYLMFKVFFFSTLTGTIGAAVVGIVMAYMGFGAWALVAQQLFNTILDTIILWSMVKWRPKKMFSFSRLRQLFSYGWKLLASALLDTVYNNVRQLIIGKKYTSADLAYYNKGEQFPSLIIVNINSSIDSVLFPVISKEQSDIKKVKSMTRIALRTSSFVIWPIVMGMAACADSIITILLSEKWIACVPYMQLFCITYGFWPIITANLNAIKALGRSDIFFKLEITKKLVGTISIAIALPFGPFAMAVAYFVTMPFNALINAFPNKNLMGYKYREQFLDILPSFLLAVFMALIVYQIGRFPFNIYLKFIAQVCVGVLVYICGAKLLKFESFELLLRIIRKRD